MPQQLTISYEHLAVDDMIFDGKKFVTVEKITICPAAVKGIPKIHINDKHCFDTLRPFEIVKG